MAGNATMWNNLTSISGVLIALVSLGISIYFWRRSFRPIVTAMVKTFKSSPDLTVYNLQLLNSGSLPAKNIRVKAESRQLLEKAFGKGYAASDEKLYLKCFNPDVQISVLQNGEKTSCSFGYTKSEEKGFWKYGAEIPIFIEYSGWFGTRYTEKQVLQIVDSTSFTGSYWGARSSSGR